MGGGSGSDTRRWICCLFIGVLGRSDYLGHFAPITQLRRLLRGAYHREFYVPDVREETVRLDPDGVISEERAKGRVWCNIPEVTTTAPTVTWASQQHVRNREGHVTERALRPNLTTQEVLVRRIDVAHS